LRSILIQRVATVYCACIFQKIIEDYDLTSLVQGRILPGHEEGLHRGHHKIGHAKPLKHSWDPVNIRASSDEM